MRLGARGALNGNPLRFDEESWRWLYESDLVPTESVPIRPCPRCGQPPTSDGHDACLGTLMGVTNACCGHGNTDFAYVDFESGVSLRGEGAVKWINERPKEAR
jgi:hypothetical protein